MKRFLSNTLQKAKKFLSRLYARSYGMDFLNKVLLYAAFLISLVASLTRNRILYLLSTLLYFIFLFRFFSTKKFARSEEDRKFRKAIRFVKLKWDNRKSHKVYMCKNCGQLIRVPKKQGKIEVTCPSCGAKKIHRT